MKNFGINYKISKNNGPKKGTLPSVDIETVEKSIEKVEQELKNKPDAVHVEYLLELYSIAVEYYSAGNDPKYEIYKKRTQEIMKSEILTKLVDEEVLEQNKQVHDEGDQDLNEYDAENTKEQEQDSKAVNKGDNNEIIDKKNIQNLVNEVKIESQNESVNQNEKENTDPVNLETLKKPESLNTEEPEVKSKKENSIQEKEEVKDNLEETVIKEPKNEEIGKISIVSNVDDLDQDKEKIKIYGSEDEEE